MTDQPGWMPPQPPQPPQPSHPPHAPQPRQLSPETKGLGIAAMVLGIVGLVVAVVPVVGLVGLFLGLLAVVLGITAVVQRKGRGQGVAGIVTGAAGVVVAGLVTLLLGLFASAVDDEMQSRGDIEVVESPASSSGEAPTSEQTSGSPAGSASEKTAEKTEPTESAEPSREPSETESSDESAGGQSDSGEAGSRGNPLALGETAVVDDWEVTIHDVTFDADEQIAAESPVNDSAPEGSSYALIDAEITYTGDGSSTSLLDVGIAYVADSGETHSWTDQIVLTPDELDRSQELYAGGTARGNVAIAVPEDGEGLVRARVGLFSTTDVFFEAG
ncbi:DUF4190 domain-containing protein [Nesterenkonia halobia]|uniref:DUF4190 domain-containing protein n=1 Tax=Nesterenkonia halobia TaxID=37922 RepID=A0ABP6RK14_9MICC